MAIDSSAVNSTETERAAVRFGDPATSSLKQDSLRETSEGEFAADAESHCLAAAFKAIGHPVRLQILDLLSRQAGPMCACHIEARFTLSQPTISHHLRLLRKAGLVNSERRGTWIYYSAAEAGVGPLHAFLNSIIYGHGGTSRGIPN
ncbi:MAG: metalloregulator ArsR/SmtB family transcription factor [Caldilineaceae bacterium]|nr:metalloregulator ArsR/SmtB family transcription factor [Caldilineaceae bacterium]